MNIESLLQSIFCKGFGQAWGLGLRFRNKGFCLSLLTSYEATLRQQTKAENHIADQGFCFEC